MAPIWLQLKGVIVGTVHFVSDPGKCGRTNDNALCRCVLHADAHWGGRLFAHSLSLDLRLGRGTQLMTSRQMFSTWSHKNTYLCALSLWTPFYVSYCTFHRSFKEKCPWSGAKAQVKYVNPGTFLLRRYRYILMCFYYVATETYCGGSEFKYLGSVPKS